VIFLPVYHGTRKTQPGARIVTERALPGSYGGIRRGVDPAALGAPMESSIPLASTTACVKQQIDAYYTPESRPNTEPREAQV
jgi:hypothetical protein